MTKLFITGTKGWLGSRFLELAEPDHQIQTFQGDVRQQTDCHAFFKNQDPGILIHLAGVIHPKRVKDFFEINTQGTLNILKSAHQAGIKRWVVMSSNSPLGCNMNNEDPFTEESSYNPYMGYGKSKMQMEIAAKALAKEKGAELVLIRAPWFYGPNQPERQTLFFKLIKAGKMPLIGCGKNKRSMAYLDNLCQGLLLAAINKTVPSDTYWIADENPYTMKDIIETVRTCLEEEGHQIAKRYPTLPGPISDIAYGCDKGLQALGVYHQKIHVLSEMNKNIFCSIDKAKKELGYHPEIALKEGMKKSIQWCMTHGYL